MKFNLLSRFLFLFSLVLVISSCQKENITIQSNPDDTPQFDASAETIKSTTTRSATLGALTLVDALVSATYVNDPGLMDDSYITGFPNGQGWVNFQSGTQIEGMFEFAWKPNPAPFTGPELVFEDLFNIGGSSYIVELLLDDGTYSAPYNLDQNTWSSLGTQDWSYQFPFIGQIGSTTGAIGSGNGEWWIRSVKLTNQMGLSLDDVVVGIRITMQTSFNSPDIAGVYITDSAVLCVSDSDGDGILDEDDNCPNDANPGQEDYDGDDIGDVCDPDDDNDGILDEDDANPTSNMEPTVVIDGCDSSIDNITFSDGSNMSDLIADCVASANNHGQFVSCVSQLTNQWKQDGLITGNQKAQINQCASGSNLP